MNRNKLKTYAPKARRAFIQAVTARASKFGISASKIEPVQVQGDVALIGGHAFPRKVAEQRRKLEERIGLRSYEQVVEEAAYTWFNRFAAIRFMEVHGYLDHGYRVLSHPEGKATPEIIEHAEHIDLPGLDREKVIDLKLDGTKDEELYRMLLTAQCNALHTAMPFLFERIDDETELLLPDNLLHSDSLVRQMVSQIDEADWQKIEIIGWLYQFYITEKKDGVIGKVVKTEDIPAATQLFTPNWIVRYMVQNALGAKWLSLYPQSSISRKMEYYISPAKQSDEADATLQVINQDQLNPEKLTFLDPACGSGHILVEAYDLFKDIYLESGYSLREIPELILRNNLFGLDIDDRAVQMASFSLLMKAREDDRRIFQKSPAINVATVISSIGIDTESIERHLIPDNHLALVPNTDLFPESLQQPTLSAREDRTTESAIAEVIRIFEHAHVLGSITPVPTNFNVHAEIIEKAIEVNVQGNDLLDEIHRANLNRLSAILRQARIMIKQYDCIVANPPYMGSKYQSAPLKPALEVHFRDFKYDLFSAFVAHWSTKTKNSGFAGFMTPFVWMFISSHQALRRHIMSRTTLTTMVQLEYSGFEGATVPVCTFTLRGTNIPGFRSSFIKLSDFKGPQNQAPRVLEAIKNRTCGWLYEAQPDDFGLLPEAVFAYWINKAMRNAFRVGTPIAEIAEPRQGMATSDTSRFVRQWHEVSVASIARGCSTHDEAAASGKKWFPFIKGGKYQKWYGNCEMVVNWQDNGRDVMAYAKKLYGSPTRTIKNIPYYFRETISWTRISSSRMSVRYYPKGYIFSDDGLCVFTTSEALTISLLCFLNSSVSDIIGAAISPTFKFESGTVGRYPYLPPTSQSNVESLGRMAIDIAKEAWNAVETSHEFACPPSLSAFLKKDTVRASFENYKKENRLKLQELADIESKINSEFVNSYGLQDCEKQRGELEYTEGDDAEKSADNRELISYSIGCMLGRYSLAEPGVIYANNGNEGFDASRYGDFPADDDGIIPITESEWFSDDAANRFPEFLKVAWSPETLKENLKFVADSLGAKANETPMDTIRRYLSRDFFKDHLKTYKKRPIYWLFSSGKEKAFECLVYLHRYNESTLSRMRMEYVTPLQGRVSARIEQLDRDIQAAPTTAAQKKLRVEQEKLKKQQAELIKFDEELRHYADKRIKLDLDDGVKVNYGKFGNLLAEVKTVTGGSDE